MAWQFLCACAAPLHPKVHLSSIFPSVRAQRMNLYSPFICLRFILVNGKLLKVSSDVSQWPAQRLGCPYGSSGLLWRRIYQFISPTDLLTATHSNARTHAHTHTHIYTPAKPILYSLEFRAMLRELFNDLHALLLLNFCSKSPKRNLI